MGALMGLLPLREWGKIGGVLLKGSARPWCGEGPGLKMTYWLWPEKLVG